MVTLITILHVVLCLFLVAVVLLQSGKGAEMGAVFGGSSQTIFGSRGAATLLSKVTTTCAIGFMVTSLALVVIHARLSDRSVIDTGVQTPSSPPAPQQSAPAAIPAPAAPETAPAK